MAVRTEDNGSGPLRRSARLAKASLSGQSDSTTSLASSFSQKSDNDTVADESDHLSESSLSDYNEFNTVKKSSLSDLAKSKESLAKKDHEFLTAHSVFGDYVRKHEIPRKVFHSSIGFITLYLYTIGVQIEKFPIGFHTAFVIILGFDLWRLNSKSFNRLYCQVLGALMRESEIHSYNGVLWYILGLDFAFTFFTKDIAVLSVLLLSWSDTAASTFGRKFGYLTPKLARNKSLAGSMAAFAVGVFSSYLFYGYFVPTYPQFNRPGDIFWTTETSYLNLHTMSLLSGVVAAFSEGIDLFNWDDNFTIPVLSSIFFYGVIAAFHK